MALPMAQPGPNAGCKAFVYSVLRAYSADCCGGGGDGLFAVLLQMVTVMESGQRERHLEARATAHRSSRRHATVVRDDDLLNERQTEASARLLRGDEGHEDPLAGFVGDARSVVVDAHAGHSLQPIVRAFN